MSVGTESKDSIIVMPNKPKCGEKVDLVSNLVGRFSKDNNVLSLNIFSSSVY